MFYCSENSNSITHYIIDFLNELICTFYWLSKEIGQTCLLWLWVQFWLGVTKLQPGRPSARCGGSHDSPLQTCSLFALNKEMVKYHFSPEFEDERAGRKGSNILFSAVLHYTALYSTESRESQQTGSTLLNSFVCFSITNSEYISLDIN